MRMTDSPKGHATILAAGGIVFREGSRPRIAIVRLRRDKSWVLPKGKLYAGEPAVAAAQREVMEETGHEVSVHGFLGTMSYPVGGKIKIVQFWHMQAVGEPVHELAYEIKAVKWLPLKEAIATLSRMREKVFLANVGPAALEAVGRSAHNRRARPAPRYHIKRASRRSFIAPHEQRLAAGA
jgi:8-oxo-dGTP diphosphatase